MPYDSMLYSPGESTMSSLLSFLKENSLSIVLHLLGIFAIALVLIRTRQEATAREIDSLRRLANAV